MAFITSNDNFDAGLSEHFIGAAMKTKPGGCGQQTLVLFFNQPNTWLVKITFSFLVNIRLLTVYEVTLKLETK